MKILIREANWLGDAVMTIPSLIALHNRFPDAQMTIAAKESVIPLFGLLPWEISLFNFSGVKSWTGLRKENFDLAVIFPNSFRSALEAFLSGAKRRIGYGAGGRSLFLTERASIDKGKIHQADYYYNLLEPIGIKGNMPRPELAIKEKDKEQILLWLKEKEVDTGQPLIVISPGASYGDAKCWPEESFAALIQKLNGLGEILFVGTKKDAPRIEKIISLSKVKAFNLAGETSLLRLAGLFSVSKLVVSNDNGAMHLAALLGVNVICLFGPTDPLRTAPIADKALILRDKVDCSPCKKRACSDKKCFHEITVDRVYNAAIRAMEKER